MTAPATSPQVEYVDKEVFPATSFLTCRGNAPQTAENIQRMLRLLAQVRVDDGWGDFAEMGQLMLLEQIQQAVNDLEAHHKLEVEDAQRGVRRHVRWQGAHR